MEIALVIAVITVIFIFRSIKIVPQQHAWVVERLGKYDRTTSVFKFVWKLFVLKIIMLTTFC